MFLCVITVMMIPACCPSTTPYSTFEVYKQLTVWLPFAFYRRIIYIVLPGTVFFYNFLILCFTASLKIWIFGHAKNILATFVFNFLCLCFATLCILGVIYKTIS